MSDKSLEKLKRDGEIETLLPDNDRYTNRFEIKSESSNRLYIVAQNKKTGDWSCSCMGWITRRRCKHLTTLTPLLAEVGKNKKSAPKRLNAPVPEVDIEFDKHDPFLAEKKVLWAKKLDGRQCRNEMTPNEEKQADKDGIIVVFGASDYLCEFHGAINEEIEIWGSEKIYFNKSGSNFTDEDGDALLHYMKDRPNKLDKNMIEAIWSPKKPKCSWAYKTKIPHTTFKVMEGKELYCVGIVFDINDLK